MEIFGIVGWKNTGNTGLMERLVKEITTRGLTVSTIKHAHHYFDVDQPTATAIALMGRPRFCWLP